MNGNGGVVEGTVVQIQGPAQVAPPPNPWRCACAALAMIVLLPFMIGLWAILLAIRIALSILGLGGRGRGRRSIIDDLVLYRGFSILTCRPDPIPIYHYVIQTPIGSVMARQEGEFVDGRIFLGHRVRLRGRERGGVLVIDQGWNETLQAELTPKRGPWRALFVVLLAILVFEIALASSAAFPTVGAGITDLWR